MTHLSPAAFTAWSVLSTTMCGFFIGHLWRFDRFKCLRWSSGPYTGAFKRFMTYTYMLTLPLLMTYSYGFTYIKYMEGYADVPHLGIVPKPYDQWPEKYQRVVFPLNLLFSFAWSLEIITHLEELCFWLFLVTAGPSQIYWFKSIYFRIWLGGSISALVYVPVVTILSRNDPLQCEARTFLAGSLGDLVITITFIPILWSFPAFLDKIKREGVNGEVMVRLRTFYEMNVIRIIFRSIFVGSVLALGIDGVRGHVHRLNEIPFWTDLFVIAGAVGCAVSSALTVLIFFPRSFGDEYEAYQASNKLASQPSKSRRGTGNVSFRDSGTQPHPNSSNTFTASKLASPRAEEQGKDAFSRNETGGMVKFAKLPVKGPGGSEMYLLTDSPVRRAQSISSTSQEAGQADQESPLHPEPESDITTTPRLHPLSTSNLPHTAVEDDNESDFDRWTQPQAPRTWRVLNQTSDADGFTATELSRKPSRRSVASLDSIYKLDNQPSPLGGANYAYLHSTPQLHMHATQEESTDGPSRRLSRGKRVGDRLTFENIQWHNAHSSRLNPLIYAFKSPIDLLEDPDPFAARPHIDHV